MRGRRLQISWEKRRRSASIAACLLLSLASCRIVSLEEDQAIRAAREGRFDAEAYVERTWSAKALPALDRRSVPLPELLSGIRSDLDQTGSRYGRRAAEGAPWSFVAAGEGVVEEIDRQSPRGTAKIAVRHQGPALTVTLQIGPAVRGTAIRDALPFIDFNDFPDQLAFAEAGRMLTKRALRDAGAQLPRLRTGSVVRFAGVFNVASPSDPIVLTPFRLTLLEEAGQ